MIAIHRPLMFGIALIVSLVLGAPGSGIAGSDPGTLDASMLEDPALWPEAVDSLRETLRRDPQNADAMLQLAQVLSWSKHFKESVKAYDRFLAVQPGHYDARVERAEVLSWMSRYMEAEQALSTLHQERPEDARVLRALARTQRWSDQPARADRSYQQALALEDESEARAEWEELRGEFRPRLDVESRMLDDDEDFLRRDTFARAEGYLGLDTRVFGAVGRIDVSRSRSSDGTPLLKGLAIPQRDHAGDYSLGFEHRFDPRWSAGLEMGWRDWKHADNRAYARGKLNVNLPGGTFLGFAASREDHTDRSRSREAIASEVRGLYTQMSLFKPLATGWETYAHVESAWLNDDNRSRGAYFELSHRPWPDRATRFSLSSRVSSYADESPDYYSPNAETGALFEVRDRFELTGALAFDAGLRGGWGFAHDTGVRDNGAEWGTSAALEWKPRAWSMRLEGDHAKTQRSGGYAATRALIRIGREF